MRVIHHSRVAWDTARLIVGAVADEDLFGWLSHEIGDLLGPTTEDALRETRDRVRRAGRDGALMESGLWRVRLEDTLRDRPEVAEELRSLTTIAAGLLRARHPGPPF